MDKETLLKLAQPAAIFALAISVISYPLVANSMQQIYSSKYSPIYVKHVNSCN